MPEATFNNHHHATRTQRPPSTAVRPDPPRPLRSYFSSPPSSFRPLRRSVATSLRRFFPFPSSLRRFVATSLFSPFPTLHRRSILFYRVIIVALCEKRTYQTNPFVSPTSILVSRSTPYAFVKLGRAGKPARACSRRTCARVAFRCLSRCIGYIETAKVGGAAGSHPTTVRIATGIAKAGHRPCPTTLPQKKHPKDVRLVPVGFSWIASLVHGAAAYDAAERNAAVAEGFVTE